MTITAFKGWRRVLRPLRNHGAARKPAEMTWSAALRALKELESDNGPLGDPNATSRVTAAAEVLDVLKKKDDQTMSRELTVQLLYLLECHPTEDTLEAKLLDLRLARRSMLTLGQAVFLWLAIRGDERDEEAILKRAFCFFDQDGSGEITEAELRDAMAIMGPEALSEDEVSDLMHLLDANADGVVGYTEFLEATLHRSRSNLCARFTEALRLEGEIKNLTKAAGGEL